MATAEPTMRVCVRLRPECVALLGHLIEVSRGEHAAGELPASRSRILEAALYHWQHNANDGARAAAWAQTGSAPARPEAFRLTQSAADGVRHAAYVGDEAVARVRRDQPVPTQSEGVEAALRCFLAADATARIVARAVVGRVVGPLVS